jgi:hypothetical protein
MKSRTLAAAGIAAAVMVGAPPLAPSASAQTSGTASYVSYVLPTVLWAATGAMIGAVAWPVIVSGAAASAAPAGIATLGALANTGAAAGALVGGVGYLLTR